jgi:hypothetical protein
MSYILLVLQAVERSEKQASQAPALAQSSAPQLPIARGQRHPVFYKITACNHDLVR